MENKMFNFKFINTGSTRLVFLIGQYAVKIPRCSIKVEDSFHGRLYSFLKGWLSNRHEYNYSKANLYDFLLPVKLSLLGSMIIIMKRAEPIVREEFLNLKEEDYNFRGYEFKEDSFGKINNKIFIVDYGN